MIWRDDDIGCETRIEVLTVIDDLFQKYRQPHTIAVMAAGMDTRPDLVQLIRSRGMLVQLHCWTHRDLRYEGLADLPQAAAMLERLFGARPTVLYPTWNRSNANVVKMAGELGMTVSVGKLSLDQYIRVNGDVEENTVNFHHWYVPEAILLEPALKIAAGA